MSVKDTRSMGERLAELNERTGEWDIYSGKKYMASSKMGLNSRAVRPVMPYQDTGHDLLNTAEFRDFMDARVAQCHALMDNIQLYRNLVQDYPEVRDSHKLFEAETRMEESWVMARYGVNEGKHHSEFDAHAGHHGEKPYEIPRGGFILALRSGDDTRIQALCDSMSRFCDTWATLKLSEDSKMQRFRRGLETDTAWVGPEDDMTRQRVASQDFLQYMAAENLGREGYYSRALSIYDDFEPRGVKAMGPGVNQDFMEKLRAVCANLSPDENIGRGFGNIKPYAMDAGSLVRQARYQMDLEHTAEMDVTKARQAEPQQGKSSSRYIGDLEAACSGIQESSTQLDCSEIV